MNRESDEACLALIASMRARAQRLMIDGSHAQMYVTHTDTERLLDNLEARIEEGAAWDGERSMIWTEVERQREQTTTIGTEFVKLTGEVERLQAKAEEAGRQVIAERERAFQVGYERAIAERGGQYVPPVEDCPCGTETCRAAWGELRDAKVQAAREQAQLIEKHGSEFGAIRFRDIIREEALAAVSAVWKDAVRHEIAGPILERRIGEVGLKDVIREEVGREVSRQLAWAFQQSKALHEAIEAPDS